MKRMIIALVAMFMMTFTTASAMSYCFAHLPEVVVLVTIDDVVGWHVLSPVTCSLVVAF